MSETGWKFRFSKQGGECRFYQVFDSKGSLVVEGKGEFINVTKYEKGTYFISFAGKKEMYIKD